jgi:predicted nucleotidyltransferase
MTTMFFDLSEKIDKIIIEALRVVTKAADTLGISFFVVGATARDIILKHCYGIEPPRMTRDIDLGVEVGNSVYYRLIWFRLANLLIVNIESAGPQSIKFS